MVQEPVEPYEDETHRAAGWPGQAPAAPWIPVTGPGAPQSGLARGGPGTGRRWVGAGAALVLVLAGAGVAAHVLMTRSAAPSQILDRPQWAGAGLQGAGDWSGWGGLAPDGGSGSAGRGRFGGSRFASTPASTAQQVGVVDVDTVLGGQGTRAAGTGMILTADGEVLTNKHVVDGETSMTVTVAATGRAYPATVVGTAVQDDVAVIKLQGASGLQPARTASGAVSVGDAVVGVGNAEGLGGTPSAAAGQVVALDQSITAVNEDGGGAERLTGLIETDAPIAPGDSGGPLFNASDQVVGMDTAGTARGAGDAFAIPIGTALAAAHQIESNPSGNSGSAGGSTGSGGSTAGRSAYLGVEVTDGAGGGAVVAAVVAGSPAAAAGLAAGDTITSVAGQPIQSIADLSAVMSSLSPGQRVPVTWTDQLGQTQQSSATLASAPAAAS